MQTNLINLIEEGLERVNKLFPTVVAPNAILAEEAFVAPVPPLVIATTPVTLDANPTVPTILEPRILVSPAPLPFVAKAPTIPETEIFVRLTPLLDAKLDRTVEED